MSTSSKAINGLINKDNIDNRLYEYLESKAEVNIKPKQKHLSKQ